ncbi:MAG TPA: hypothetical protein VKT77_11465 [Chthonomonadaceae bacterium]|nr:hypothetical protein [Chthonomonadaceae bacterium]
MSDIAAQSLLPTEREQEVLLDQLIGEMQRLNATIRDDQADIDRLKTETRALSEHSDLVLAQIEARLASLKRAS